MCPLSSTLLFCSASFQHFTVNAFLNDVEMNTECPAFISIAFRRVIDLELAAAYTMQVAFVFVST